MRLLLDTRVFLWWRGGGRRIGPVATDRITNARQVYVSAASAWECAIKVRLGKLTLPGPFGEGVDHSGFDRLPVTIEHAEGTGDLPGHHRDPFDRLLVSQANCEGLVFVTADDMVMKYDLRVLPAKE